MADATPLSQFHEAYLALEDRIVTLEFAPGAKLTEKAIIAEIGFGRTPVREALQRLALEGLVEVQPRSGIKIAEIRPEDYPRAMEPRLSLEPLLARAAARFAGPKDRAEMSLRVQEMQRAARRGEVRAYLRADKALDEALGQASANPFLPRILSPLQIHSRRFWFHYHGADGLEAATEGHVAVCQAIILGDAEAAFARSLSLMEHLFTESRARVSPAGG